LSEKLTPMMQQYLDIKNSHQDKVVFFQVGDFYEVFYEDAEMVSRELDIILTTRDVGKDNPVPLAGVPVHAVSSYTARLIEKGYKIVICDQVEDASLAKGLVKREVTRITTPGTVTDPDMLEDTSNNYLAALVREEGEKKCGLAVTDISTGSFWVTEIKGDNSLSTLKGEWQRIQPSECICPQEVREDDPALMQCLEVWNGALIERMENSYFSLTQGQKEIAEQWGEECLRALNPGTYPLAVKASGALLMYIKKLYQRSLQHLRPVEMYFPGEYMVLDGITRRNLELVQTIREGKKKGSLLEVLDHSCSSMGGRMLKRWVEQPLKDLHNIKLRQEGVRELVKKEAKQEDLRSFLKKMWDLERLCSRLNFGNVNARDLVALRKTLEMLPRVKESLEDASSQFLHAAVDRLPLFADLVNTLEEAIVEEPPLTLNEGGIIKDGYSPEVDQLRTVCREGKDWLLELEKKERERTGIKSLKVGYNRVFGYYIEVTKANLHLVPVEYHRKQTLVNAERYITEELKRMEEQITGADQRVAQLEQSLFEEIRKQAIDYTEQMQKASEILAELDCLQSLARAALQNNYKPPLVLEEDSILEIKQGRHPVVEKVNPGERFVPNDIYMSREEKMIVLTGPNMAGKSTYCRSVALISLMAQMGGFVPAESAKLPVMDRIFARVGASDDLSSGQSTFMVEMNETASILEEATSATLILLDEIGRGTSTYDGMSIARSVMEYIQQNIGAWTLFSTHYHELTVMEEELEGVKNYTVLVKEKGSSVVFLRKVVPGRADKSYGINVARLAGMPEVVVKRAEAILNKVEKQNGISAGGDNGTRQLSLIDLSRCAPGVNEEEKEIIEEIKESDPDTLTPLEALQKLYNLKEKASRLEKKEV